MSTNSIEHRFGPVGDASWQQRAELLNQPVPTEQQQTRASLVQEAFEHPVRTALTVTAVAAAGGAICYAARRGHLDAVLPWRKPGVLLIEDTPGMGRAFKEVLTNNGHEVTWVTGIKSLKPFTGVTVDGAEVALCNTRLKIALVDGNLGKNHATGAELIRTLTDNKFVSIGTSTVDKLNAEMLERGAMMVARKPMLYAGIMGRHIDLKATLYAPEKAKSGLERFIADFNKARLAPLREKADERLMHFLVNT